MKTATASSREASLRKNKFTLTKFTDMPLSAGLQQKLALLHLTIPTPVQASAIPPALEGRDVLATAQAGTEKTLAFLIPVLEKMNAQQRHRQISTLILVPTCELAMQVHEAYESLRGRMQAPAALVIGGASERRQMDGIRRGANVVVATPGRLEDYLRRKRASGGASLARPVRNTLPTRTLSRMPGVVFS